MPVGAEDGDVPLRGHARSPCLPARIARAGADSLLTAAWLSSQCARIITLSHRPTVRAGTGHQQWPHGAVEIFSDLEGRRSSNRLERLGRFVSLREPHSHNV